jgi:serine protease
MFLLRPVPALLALLLGVLPAFGSTPNGDRGPQRLRPSAAAEDSSQARVIVQYRDASGLMQARSATGGARVRPQHAGVLGQRLGLPLQDGRVLGERVQAVRGQGLSSSALAAKLRLQDDVEWAVVDERRYISAAPNDPLYAAKASTSPAVGQWYLRAPDAAVTSATKPVVASINAEAAWTLTPGSASITVAVLDTGVRYDHPDFVRADGSSKLWPGYDFVSDATSAGDGSGRDSDANDPGDWSTSGLCGKDASGQPIPGSNSSWHGTQTAGLVGAATDNNVGMASVGRNTMVLPLRVLGKCGGSDSDIIAAMYWAAGIAIPGDTSTPANPHPAQVISMSLGKSGSCPASYNSVFTALAAAKVTVVIAAGNSNGLAVEAPANCSGALAVAGVRHIGSKVGYSSIGPQVAIAAPAGNCVNTTGACLYPILTTINKGTTTPTTNGYSDGLDISVGTSFAAPVVAGTVALMLAMDPTLAPASVASKIKSTARAFPSTGSTDTTVAACKAPSATEQLECYCTTTTCGAGLLDAGAAVAAVGVAPPTAAIGVSSSSPTAGQSVTLSASAATAHGGRSIAGYQWQITSGGSFAAFSGVSNGASATLLTSAAGSVVVSLAVTDSASASGSASSTISVQAVSATPATPAATGGSSGGGSGGGAMSAAWVAGLGLAAGVLYRTRRRAACRP